MRGKKKEEVKPEDTPHPTNSWKIHENSLPTVAEKGDSASDSGPGNSLKGYRVPPPERKRGRRGWRNSGAALSET